MQGRGYLPLGLVLAIASTSAVAAADTAATDALLARGQALEHSDPAAARALFVEALANLPPGPARGEALGVLCSLNVGADAAAGLAAIDPMLAEVRAAEDAAGETRLLRCAGYAHELLGDMGAAAIRYGEAVAVGEANGVGAPLANALAARGELRHFNGQYDDAIADLKRAHDLAAAAGDDSAASYALNAMANFYADRNVGDYDKAIALYRELLVRHERAGSGAEVVTAHFNLGATLESKLAFADALVEYRKALALAEEQEDADSVAETRRVIGAVLVKQGKAIAALPWIDQALDYYRSVDDADGIARTHLTRGIARRGAGRAADALADLAVARAHFVAEDNPRFLVRIDEEGALAHADLGQWQAAYAALREQFDTQRTLDRTVADERTARLRVQFDSERTEAANRLLAAENASRGLALEAAVRERGLQRRVLVLGALLMALVALLAVRELVKARRLRVLAMTDELTGVANRRSILAFLAEAVRSARRGGAAPSLVSFDIDHFKRLNDTHGHDAGDRALRQVVAIAAGALRGSDRLGRVGGEEFLVVLPGTSGEVAGEIAERVRQAVANTMFDNVAEGTRITLSLGVARWNGAGDDQEAMVKRADQALYGAKQSGRNRVVSAEA